jgi:hypothetical protein
MGEETTKRLEKGTDLFELINPSPFLPQKRESLAWRRASGELYG